MTAHKSVTPFYTVAVIWLVYALVFPLYQTAHFVIVGITSVIAFAIVSLLCRNTGKPQTEAKKEEKKEAEKPTGNAELDKMIKDGRLAIAEMKRLDDNIEDAEISADIVRLEQVSQKIFDRVKEEPSKLTQIHKFMDYYLPTTLKLLNAYDRASAAGVSGENINATMSKVAGIMKTIVTAFEKQLDALFGDQALDISTDITVLENMMAREGLAGDQLHAQSSPKDGDDIKLEFEPDRKDR